MNTGRRGFLSAAAVAAAVRAMAPTQVVVAEMTS